MVGGKTWIFAQRVLVSGVNSKPRIDLSQPLVTAEHPSGLLLKPYASYGGFKALEIAALSHDAAGLFDDSLHLARQAFALFVTRCEFETVYSADELAG